ncbi:unnamed protein product [Cylicocyclus nassatus]|uniref:tRNA (34-2'-O)-methyltransferase regulator WDR6 n=1 Tax=Cylicocyclus nassatus TaxID=53992 RepID=A0AA36MHR2_CYLNA|nr:unnamed protein product [Cylicocyclus nassatus]
MSRGSISSTDCCRRLAILKHESLLLSANGSRIEVFDNDVYMQTIYLDAGADITKMISAKGGVLVLQERSLYFVRNEAIFSGDRNLLRSALDRRTANAISTESRALGKCSLSRNDDSTLLPTYGHSDLQSRHGNGSRLGRKIVKRKYESNLIGCHFLEKSEEVIVVTSSLDVLAESLNAVFGNFYRLCHVVPKKLVAIISCLITGTAWKNLLIVAGAWSGELIISRPWSREEAYYDLEHGLVYSLSLFGSHLCCVCDDRALLVYDIAPILEADELNDSLQMGNTMEAYAHSARPYVVAVDDQKNIFTAGQDETLMMWRISSTGLQLICKQVLRVGYIRAILLDCESVYVASDYGNLVRVYKSDLENEAILSWDPVTAVKSFTRMSNGSVQILRYEDESSARFLSKTSLGSPSSDFAAVVQDSALRIFRNKQEIRCINIKKKITAVHIHGSFAFVFYESILAEIINLESYSCFCVLNFEPAIKRGAKRKEIKFTTFAIHKFGQRFSIALGTVSGQIFYVTGFDGATSPLNVHSSPVLNSVFKHHPITHLWIRECELNIVGRNGILAVVVLKPNGKVAILSARPLCPYLPHLVPVAMNADNTLILAFSGNIFYVVDYYTQSILDQVDCGGAHRNWYFSAQNCSDLRTRYFFDFIAKGRLVTAHLDLKSVKKISDAPHRTDIVDICLMHEDSYGALLSTVAADHSITIFSLGTDGGERKDAIKLYNEAKPTCMCSHAFSRLEWVLYVGGEKSAVTTWLVTASDIQLSDPKYVTSSVYYRDHCAARVVSIATNSNYENVLCTNHHAVVAYADGVLEIIQPVLEENQPTVALQLLKRININSEILFPVQVSLRVGAQGELEIDLAATSGRHGRYSFEPTLHLHRQQSVVIEQCGLSAIFVYPIEDGGRKIIAVGSESGYITVAVCTNNGTTVTASKKVHSGTVTSLQGRRVGDKYQLASVSLDCRLILWNLSHDAKEIDVVQICSLDVRDPSSLAFVGKGALVVGNGMESMQFG